MKLITLTIMLTGGRTVSCQFEQVQDPYIGHPSYRTAPKPSNPKPSKIEYFSYEVASLLGFTEGYHPDIVKKMMLQNIVRIPDTHGTFHNIRLNHVIEVVETYYELEDE